MNDRLFVTRHTAQRAARRALGTDNAAEGVHFTTAKVPEGWTWTGIPGEALDALSEQVRRTAMLGRQEHGPTADEAGVPNFLRNDFKGLEAMTAKNIQTIEDGRAPLETPEARKARKPGKDRTVEKTKAKPTKAPGKKEAALRALREKAATAKPAPKAKGKTGHPAIKAVAFTPAAQEPATAPEAETAAVAPAKPAKAPRAPKAAKPAPVEGAAKVNKTAIVGTMLARPEGATLAELLEATGWPAMSVPRQADLAKLDLRKEKEAGKPTRYFGTPKASA